MTIAVIQVAIMLGAAAGTLRVHVGRVFSMDQVVDAHRLMEADAAGGKIVVLA